MVKEEHVQSKNKGNFRKKDNNVQRDHRDRKGKFDSQGRRGIHKGKNDGYDRKRNSGYSKEKLDSDELNKRLYDYWGGQSKEVASKKMNEGLDSYWKTSPKDETENKDKPAA